MRGYPMQNNRARSGSDPRLSARDMAMLEHTLETLLRPLAYDEIDAWRADVNRALRSLLRADKVSFQLPLPGHPLLLMEHAEPALVERYTSRDIPRLVREKQYAARILQLGVGNRALLWGKDRGWLYSSAYYNETIIPLRAFDPVWASAPVAGSHLPAVLLAHHDRPFGRRFGERGLAIMRLIRPALAAAASAVQRLRPHRHALGSTLDTLPFPLLVYEGSGQLSHQNPAASALLAAEPYADDILATARATALALGPGNGGAPDRAGAARRTIDTPCDRYRLSASLMPAGSLAAGDAVLVTIDGGHRTLPTARELEARFALTARQADIALLLAQRMTNREIAEALHISINTVHRHAEAVMSKLSVRSRRDIAKRIGAEVR